MPVASALFSFAFFLYLVGFCLIFLRQFPAVQRFAEMLRFDFVGSGMHICRGLVFGVRIFLELYIYRFSFAVQAAAYIVVSNAYTLELIADFCIDISRVSLADLVVTFAKLVSI